MADFIKHNSDSSQTTSSSVANPEPNIDDRIISVFVWLLTEKEPISDFVDNDN